MEHSIWWEPLPWNYAKKVEDFLRPEVRVLDVSPAEGAFPFLSGEPGPVTRWSSGGELPFEPGSFDLLISRHGGLCPEEAARVLGKGGFLVTEQVGGSDAWEPGEPDYNLENWGPKLEKAGFRVVEGRQAYPLGPGGLRGHRFLVVAKRG